MKKNYFSLFAAATMMMAVTSCSQEEDFVQNSSSDMVSFKINLEGAAPSRAAGDGKTATQLYYEVYQGGRKVLDNFGDDKNRDLVTIEDGKASVDMPLLRGEEYEIMFWAQAPTGSIYNPENLKEIKVDYTNPSANNEANDAFFYGKPDFKVTSNVTEITLRRPFAQLNIGTTEEDWGTAIDYISEGVKPVTLSEVVVTNLATKFNVLVGEASEPTEEPVRFEKTELLKHTDEKCAQQFTVERKTYRNLAMNYLLVPGKVSSETPEVKGNTNVKATFWRDEQELFSITNLVNVPIQRNWRTNILGNLLADPKTFNITIDPYFNNEDHNITLGTASTSEELETMLKQDLEHIVIDLAKVEGRAAEGKVYTLNIGAGQEEYYFGGTKTKTITINANGNTINFVQNNSDWNYVRNVNDEAKWIINDAHLTSSGKNTGHWSRNLIRFYNEVEFNNVTSEKGLCMMNDANLNNLDINVADENYALWITAQGQIVNVDGLNVVATNAGRGIKIGDENYEDVAAKVSLNVKNSKFATAKKAAILVSSIAGADIILENIDIADVAADGFNAVWVDEDWNNIDAINVAGGFVVVEGDKTAENPFSVENGTVKLPAGTFVVPANIANGLTIEGAENGTTVLDMAGRIYSNIEGLTFKNLTIKLNNENYKGIQHASNLIYENCVINGTLWLYATAQFNNCIFNVEGDAYNVWTYGSKEVTFNECTFNSDGKSVLVYNEGTTGSVVTMNKCNFNATNAVEGKAAVEIDSSLLKEGMEYIVNLNECTVTGFGKGSVSNDVLFNPKKGSKATVYIDGAKAVWNAETLKSAIAAANNTAFTNIVLTDATFTGAFNIDGKKVNIDARNRHAAVIDGLVFGLGASEIHLNNITLTNANPVGSGIANRNKADYYCLGAYAAEFVIDNCVFNVSNQGLAAGKGAINIGDGFNANPNPYELTVKNTVFNCNGERPIRAKTRSYIENCTFNDQHRYAIQVQGNYQAPDEKVYFVNNTIVDACKTSGEPFAASVSISGAQLLETVDFVIQGNTPGVKFVYDLKDNVKITTCTLNGQLIPDYYCLPIEGVDDAMEVGYADLMYSASEKTYFVTAAAGLVELSAKTIKGGEKVLLLADIDLKGVSFNGLSAFNSEQKNTFDGQGYTISNWSYDGKASNMGFIKSWVGEIKNVNFENCHLKTAGRSAIVAANTYASINDITVKDCSIEDSYWACGIVAGLYNAGDITNCTVTNSSVKSNGGTGGIVGVINETTGTRTLKNCSVKNSTVNNTGAYGETYSGGCLVGMFNCDATFVIENCKVENNTLLGLYTSEKYPENASVTEK